MGDARTVPRAWRRLGVSFAVGALWDAAWGLAILLAARPAAEVMGLALPPDPTYLRLNGIFLLMLAGVYALAARDAQRYAGVVPIAIVGRAAGFLAMTVAWAQGAGGVFLWLAYADLLLAAIQGWLWLDAGWSTASVSWRPQRPDPRPGSASAGTSPKATARSRGRSPR